jgi:methionine-rich copper-binding protein CopC
MERIIVGFRRSCPGKGTIMKSSRFGVIGLPVLGLLCIASGAWAQDIHVMTSNPAASAVIESRSSEFFVRFDRPVDHLHSLLSISRDGKVVETLHPRDSSAASVLFARAPTLTPGSYMLHWSVRMMTGSDVAQGDIPFTVSNAK